MWHFYVAVTEDFFSVEHYPDEKLESACFPKKHQKFPGPPLLLSCYSSFFQANRLKDLRNPSKSRNNGGFIRSQASDTRPRYDSDMRPRYDPSSFAGCFIALFYSTECRCL